MEKNIRRVTKTDSAGIFLREFGKGRVVYFPWDIDRVFWEVMVDDHGRLLRNAIDWAIDEEPPVTVTGPGVLDVTVWRQKDSMTVHLVNLTNPMMMRPSFREPIPSPPQQVGSGCPGQAREGAVPGGRRDAARPTLPAARSPLTDALHPRPRSDRRRFLVMGEPGGLKICTSRLDRVPSESPVTS